MRRSIITLFLIVAGSGVAHADREGRAKALWDQRCANCHALSNGRDLPPPPLKRFVDLTRVHARKEERELREWIANPNKVAPNTNCEPGKLEPQQIDLLVGLLKKRSQPRAALAAVPEAQSQPPQPESQQPRKQPRGQVKR
jgi:hypothetical protein